MTDLITQDHIALFIRDEDTLAYLIDVLQIQQAKLAELNQDWKQKESDGE